jgi:hypothetical protein
MSHASRAVLDTQDVMPHYLVVGYDGLAGGDQALHHATVLAEDWSDTRLLVTYVTPIARIAMFSGGMPEAVALLLSQEVETAAGLSKRVASQLQDCTVDWRFLHKMGDVADELGALADTFAGVGIVVGQPRTLLRRIGGSVPARLGRSASRRIFVV